MSPSKRALMLPLVPWFRPVAFISRHSSTILTRIRSSSSDITRPHHQVQVLHRRPRRALAEVVVQRHRHRLTVSSLPNTCTRIRSEPANEAGSGTVVASPGGATSTTPPGGPA